MNLKKLSTLSIIPIFFLVACSASDKHSGNEPPVVSPSPHPPQKHQLRPVAPSELETYIKVGMKNIYASSNYYLSDKMAIGAPVLALDDMVSAPSAEIPSVGGSATGGPASGGGIPQFSTTNVIENGVDEADVMKFDGVDMYLVEPYHQFFYPVAVDMAIDKEPIPEGTAAIDPAPDVSNAIRILRPNTTSANSTEIAHYTLPTTYFTASNIEGMYLQKNGTQKHLAVIGEHWSNTYPTMAYWGYCGMWANGKTNAYVLDVSDPTNISPTVQLDIDGYLVESRRIDETLYLITRYTPSQPEILIAPPFVEGQYQEAANAAIDTMTLDELLPKIRIDGVSKNLVEAADCFVDGEQEGYPTLMVVSAINLNNPTQIKSTCVTANTYGMYMSTKSLYLYQVGWENDGSSSTNIYQFSLTTDGATYTASGKVNGYPTDPFFSLSEHKDILRIVTSSGNWNTPKNELYTLEQQSAKLKVLGQLPNEAHPEPIGKPNERIQSVRFAGDRAYVVTFLQTDPFYVIDLSNPAEPYIAGELEIPGFSSILQPLSDNLLLGFGSENNQFKLELYDVTNANQPVSASKLLLTGYSEAQWDYKAISLLTDSTSGLIRVGVPFYKWDITNSLTNYGAQMFTVDTAIPQLEQTGLMQINDSTTSYFYPTSPRILLFNDFIHYTSGINVWSGIFGVDSTGVKQ